MNVGIPRGLLFYEYAPMWVAFFENLGANVVTSDKTNKKILNEGTKLAVIDSCIPVKLFHGHVLNLKEKVDYLFIPRIMGVYQNEYICPKICGLPEMIRFSFNDLPVMINTKIDLRKKDELKKTFYEIGEFITHDKKKIDASYSKALETYSKSKNQMIKDLSKSKKKVMLMGHPYILYDDYLNMNIKNKLIRNGYEVVTPEMFSDDLINEYASQYQGKIYWYFFRKMIGTCNYLLDKKDVDGLVYISSFGCGIDSVVIDTIERRVRKETNIPFMLMTLDEHSGEAGFNTRLEAFIDMLKWRNEDESYVPTHG